MLTIGIRELRQRASEYLRRVEAGETVEVTDRGRPIARITPIPTTTPTERLVKDGRLRPAEDDLLELGDPLPPSAGIPLPSDLLERSRAEER